MQLIRITEENIEELNNIIEMIYDEWGSTFSSPKEVKLNKLKQPILNNEYFPQAYLLKENNESIGAFLILEHELEGSDLSPWLACVVIGKKYRGKGYGGVLLKYIEDTIEKSFSKIYLTTEHIDFYEKIGFKFIKIIDNNGKNNRLYCKTCNNSCS